MTIKAIVTSYVQRKEHPTNWVTYSWSTIETFSQFVNGLYSVIDYLDRDYVQAYFKHGDQIVFYCRRSLSVVSNKSDEFILAALASHQEPITS